jgi:hypothetical protein
MKRWASVLAAAAAIIVIEPDAATAATAKVAAGPEQFAQAFYDWYSSFYDKYDLRRPTPPDVAAIKQRSALFDRTLARMIVADAEAQSRCKGSIVGLDYDPFLQVQDTGGQFRVMSAEPANGGYQVNVFLDGKPHVRATVEGGPGHWRFTDFADAEGHAVRDVLKMLKRDASPCPKS